jgi:16S rRNA (cytosine967-C5)-methyltransferase
MPNPPQDARFIAYRVLESVLDRGQAFDHVLENSPGLSRLEPRDRGFVRLLTATVLRHLGTLDHAVTSALTHDDMPSSAWNVLRMGLTQLHYLKTPPHAAISTSVDLAAIVAPRLKGLVNAVLRRHESLAFDDSPAVNLPDWLWARWVAHYGEPTAMAMAEACAHEAPLDITVKAEAPFWAEALNATIMPMGTLRRDPGGGVVGLPGFEEGAWWVQDLAASLPVGLMGDVSGKTVYDLCAAPGGKTAQLAAGGAKVTAVDRAANRLRRLQDNLGRLRLTADTVIADATAWTPSAKADAILLDAPCLATGTLRRHPDIPWLKTAADLEALVALQARLLDHAATLLQPGGTLVYCTCSMEPEEGEQQVESFLARTPGMARRAITPAELPGLEMAVTAEGDVRILPHYLAGQGGIDGFYIARLAAQPPA